MSPFKAVLSYRALTPAQKRILREKQIELLMPPDAWLNFLDNLATFDRHGDQTRKLFGTMAVLGLVFFILLGMLQATETLELPYPALVLGTVAALAVLGTLIWAIFRGVDLHNNLRGFVLPMVAVLREDMDPQEKLALEMDFRGAVRSEKQVDENTYYPHGGSNPKIRETHFTDPWLIGKACLADGGLLEWRIEDRVRRRRITKRNARGKTKFKTKYKVKRCIEARLSLARKRYALSAGTAGDRLKVREGDKRNAFKVRHVVESGQLDEVLNIHAFLDPVAEAYERVRPASKKKGGSP